MIANSTPISVVKSKAVWASDIAEWWYCGWKLMLADKHGEEETAEMSEGKVKHDLQSEEDYLTLIEKGFKPRKAIVRTVGDIQRLNLQNLKSIRDDVVLPDNRSNRFYGIVLHDPPIVGVPDAINARYKDGKKLSIAADTVVICVGSKPSDQLYTALEGKVSELYRIGDCEEPARILEAIHAGTHVGHQI